MLTADEITEIDRRIQRAGASNCWTGTLGSLAADARRLVRHIQETSPVCNRSGSTWFPPVTATGPHLVGPPGMQPPVTAEDAAYPVDHILRGAAEVEGRRYLGDEMEREDATVIETEPAGPSAAVALLDTARAAVMDRHAVYGPPTQHFARTVGMVNALFSSVLKRPLTVSDWARIMLLDKLARDLGPKPHPDNAVDLAGYAACLAECEASAPPPGV